MRLRDLSISVAAILTLTAVPVSAAPKSAPAKSAAPKITSMHGSPKTVTSPKPVATTASGSQKTASLPHGQAKKVPTAGTTTTAASTTTAPTTSTSTMTPRLNPIAQKISSKPQLSSKISRMLPAGMTLNQASKGFKNQGQFIAALHVSQNLGISFADLKTAMTGIRPTTKSTTTGGTFTRTTTEEKTPLLSLGQAIQKLRPNADAGAVATEATTQATTDLGGK